MESKKEKNPALSVQILDWCNWIYRSQNIFNVMILILIYILAFSIRLFSVVRFESVIHEFDPYFNYRTTKYLIDEGFYNFHNWFDSFAWYPLGRIIGGTLYPGLMITSAVIYWLLHLFHITIEIRNVCVLLAPFMASNTTLIIYFLTKEVRDSKSGLLAAILIAIIPGGISRSVAGSYDNEGIAVFALVLTFYFWIKAVKTGSMLWGGLCALAYFYMVAAWGGYIFIINLIPIHVIVLVLAGRYSRRLYVAYSTLYILGTLLSMQITFVGFQPVRSSEHMGSMIVFICLQIYGGYIYLKSIIPPENRKKIFKYTLGTLIVGGSVVFLFLTIYGYISPWTGRFYSLLDPTYSRIHLPIIISVSEHQPTVWSSFFMDLHVLVFFIPAGFWYCFKEQTDTTIFILLYTIISLYFTGVMVRLMIVLAPAAAVIGAVAISHSLTVYNDLINLKPAVIKKKYANRKIELEKSKPPLPKVYGISLLLFFLLILFTSVYHGTWITSEAYSSPSIVLSSYAPDEDGLGYHKIIFDDFREAYSWIKFNTKQDAKVMSWWDYGYQITAMANRTVLVDNNTWNNTHIATVGKAMATDEDTAFEIMQKLDVDYVLVIFGGLTGYPSDDINKFLWMIRIGGGVYPEIIESDYYSEDNQYRIDEEASSTMMNSLMYKLSYYRYGEIPMESPSGMVKGFDRVRHAPVGNKDIELNHLEEAFTSEHWIVRVYKVLPPYNKELFKDH